MRELTCRGSSVERALQRIFIEAAQEEGCNGGRQVCALGNVYVGRGDCLHHPQAFASEGH